MSAGQQITGWPAHDSAISSILFGPDETSIFSLGVDGKARTLKVILGMKLNYAFEVVVPLLFELTYLVCTVRFLNGACKTKVKFFGQGTVAGTEFFATTILRVKYW